RFIAERDQWDAIGVWNGLRVPDSVIVAAARRAGLPVVHFELGAFPESLSIDLRGVNFDNSVPRDPAFYLRQCEEVPARTQTALKPRKPRRGKRVDVARLPERFLFAPFQVNYDTQVVAYSPWVPDMRAWYELLARMQRRLQAAGDPRVIVLREHPSCTVHYPDRSEERRVGKECRSRWSPYQPRSKPDRAERGTTRPRLQLRHGSRPKIASP